MSWLSKQKLQKIIDNKTVSFKYQKIFDHVKSIYKCRYIPNLLTVKIKPLPNFVGTLQGYLLCFTFQMLPPITCVTDMWNVYVPSDVLSCTARCSVPARKLTSSGRKRFEKETYSTARQHSTKPDVTSCNDLTGHWGHTNQRETHRYDEMLNRKKTWENECRIQTEWEMARSR